MSTARLLITGAPTAFDDKHQPGEYPRIRVMCPDLVRAVARLLPAAPSNRSTSCRAHRKVPRGGHPVTHADDHCLLVSAQPLSPCAHRYHMRPGRNAESCPPTRFRVSSNHNVGAGAGDPSLSVEAAASISGCSRTSRTRPGTFQPEPDS
jgi:hypothetical protein